MDEPIIKPMGRELRAHGPADDRSFTRMIPSPVRVRRPSAGGWAVVFLAADFLAADMERGLAQVVLDGKFGTSGPLSGPSYDITAGLGATRGNNLFHSFTQFDLVAGDTATFSGPANIQSILARVTGGNRSSIDGTVRSSIAGANLFLINPSGILFGPNAVVDVSGSFAASTANYLKLANGARFVAALDADDSALTTDPVVAFGFLDGSNGSIEVRGSLKAGTGTSLSVVGSTVSVADGAQLEAINGPMRLTGVGAGFVGEVPFTKPSGAVGSGAPGADPAPSGGNGGNVQIRGGRLVVDNAVINVATTGGDIRIDLTEGLEVLNGGLITTANAGDIKGGNVIINAPSILVDGKDGPAPTRIAAETFGDDARGTGGNIVIQSDSVELHRGAEISVSTFGAANAGRVDITATSLKVEGSDAPQFPTQIAANAAPVFGTASGAGGQIVIHANSVEVGNGAGILATTIGDSNAGSIDLTAGSLTVKNGGLSTYTGGAGAGGEIRIHTDQLTLDGPFSSISVLSFGLNGELPAGNGGVINITTGSFRLLNDAAVSGITFGDGKGGNIRITADSVLLDTATFETNPSPGISSASNLPFFGESLGGRGGDIEIVAGSMTLRGGMPISATTFTPGAGGNIDIKTGTLTLESQASIQSASLSTGRAGTISLQAAHDIMLSGKSTVNTSAPLSSGGDIRMGAGGEIRIVDSQVTAQAGPAGGGNIQLTAPSLIYLLNGTLNAQAEGDGGNLTIDPVFFILDRSSLISKSSSANGGNITILSDFFFQSASIIDASAPFGLPGTVSVSAPQVDLSGSLIALPANLLGVETQLRPDCGVRLSGNISSFIVIGRGGLPLSPGGFLPSGLIPHPDENK